MKEWKGYRHGINLGGWLSQCVHTTAHYDSFIVKEDIKVIADWGLDHIRVPIDYNLLEEADGAAKQDGYKYIDNAIGWCREYGLNMILDLHKTAGYSFDMGHGESGFFDSEDYQERFYKLWEELAHRYGDNSDMLAFELLNEVTDKSYCDPWNRISTECIKRIRAIAPDIKILLGGYYNNSVEAIPDLAMPYDENIIYNFHCYEPLIFTHQGAGWIPTMDTSFRTSIGEKCETLAAQSVKQLEYEPTAFDTVDRNAPLDSSYFERIFGEAVKVAEERDVALYCGEYGVIDRTSPGEALAWYKLISAAFEKLSIGRAAWTYRCMDFGISDDRMNSVRDELIGLL
ncbi:MAG: glycoside hydrolase family 5 protein [Lachnospiraceae bacterium]|nr:glycoside hydrolase family 5 protein [Lachnospiraceae bacterium]